MVRIAFLLKNKFLFYFFFVELGYIKATFPSSAAFIFHKVFIHVHLIQF